MKRRFFGSTLCLAAALGLLAGCTKESPRGGPGAVPPNASDNANSFKVDVPKGTTDIKQGEQREVTVSVNRGNKFDQDVMVTIKPPAGIEAHPDKATAKKGTDAVKVTLKANSDAKMGKEEVEVIGTPTTGQPAEVRFTIDVKAKG